MELEIHSISLIILTVLTYFYVTRPRIRLYTEISFCCFLFCGIICDVTGIISALCMVNSLVVNHFILMFCVKAHLNTHLLMAALGAIYIASNVYRRVEFQFYVWGLSIATALLSVILFILPVSVFNNGHTQYFFGETVHWTFICCLLIIVAGIYCLITNREKVTPSRRMAFAVWIVIWVAAIVLYFAIPDFKFLGAAGSLSVLIIFIALENPLSNIDRDTGFFNSPSFMLQVKHNYENNVNFSIIAISMESINIEGTGVFQVDQLMDEIVRFFRTLEHVKIFRVQQRDYYLVMKNSSVMNEVYEKLDARFSAGWVTSQGHTVCFMPFFLKVPYSEICNSAPEFGELFSFLHNNLQYYKKGQTLVVDFDLAREPSKRNMTQTMVLDAMKEGRVEVFYQPIYSLVQKKFLSAEALARIRNEKGDLVMPGTFIPVIETTGNIVQFGELVFAEVCRFLSEVDTAGLGIEYIEVNVSIKQLEQPGLADTFISLMEKYGVNPACINLEVTESGSLTKHGIIDSNIMKLLAHGVEFSLDDFGSGESNLDYMLNMPVKIIKYDKDMTQAYFTNDKAKYVVPYVTELAHEMELKVVSEGVENAAQLESMRSFGVDYIQGYYFSRPLPKDEYVAFLRSHFGKKDVVL